MGDKYIVLTGYEIDFPTLGDAQTYARKLLHTLFVPEVHITKLVQSGWRQSVRPPEYSQLRASSAERWRQCPGRSPIDNTRERMRQEAPPKRDVTNQVRADMLWAAWQEGRRAAEALAIGDYFGGATSAGEGRGYTGVELDCFVASFFNVAKRFTIKTDRDGYITEILR